MFSLVLKDILVQKKNLWFIVFYGIFFHVAMYGMENMAYVAGAVAVAYIFIVGACAVDEKNKSELLLNSLPIDRKHIVLSKYLTALVFLVIGSVTSALTGAVMKIAGLPMPAHFIGVEELWGIFAAITLFTSVYFPLYFKFGYMKTRYITTFLFLFTFFLPGLLAGLLKGNEKFARLVRDHFSTLNAGAANWAPAILLAAMVLLAVISLLISIKAYRRREFA